MYWYSDEDGKKEDQWMDSKRCFEWKEDAHGAHVQFLNAERKRIPAAVGEQEAEDVYKTTRTAGHDDGDAHADALTITFGKGSVFTVTDGAGCCTDHRSRATETESLQPRRGSER